MQRIRILSAAIATIVAMWVATAAADPSVKQMQLAEKQVLAFIAAQQVMRGILEVLPEEEQDNPPPAVQAQLEANAKKQGFKNFQEYDDVAVNIFLIWSANRSGDQNFHRTRGSDQERDRRGLCPKTLSADEKKEMLKELNEALNSVQPIQFPENIELIRKYYDRIQASLN